MAKAVTLNASVNFLGLQNKYASVQMHDKWRNSEPQC